MMKQYGVPILIILLAAVLVCVAFLPLGSTQWPNGFRVATDPAVEEGDSAGGIIMIIGPLIKVTILMGIGVLLTALGRQLARLKR